MTDRYALPEGWYRLGKRHAIAAHNRNGDSGEGSKEYHATLYRLGYKLLPSGHYDCVEVDDLLEAYCYNATHLGMTLALDTFENRFSLSLGLPFWTFGLRGGRPRYPSREREYGWSYHNHTLWLLGGRDPMTSSREDPWWWENTIDFKKLLFGKTRYSQRKLDAGAAKITMPEGDYYANVELYEARWDSPRPVLGRFVRKRVRRAEVDLITPIPIPGKGENSYDIDDDAIYSTSLKADSIGEAVACVRDDALMFRERYGGSELWLPGRDR